MKTPKIGQDVLFWPDKDNELIHVLNKDKPMYAVVVYVWSQTVVNLCVYDHNGNSFASTSVLLVQGRIETPDNGYYCKFPNQGVS